MISLSASCGVASGLALTGDLVGCSRLMGRVFALIRLRASGSTYICLSPSGPGRRVLSLCFLPVSVGCPLEVRFV